MRRWPVRLLLCVHNRVYFPFFRPVAMFYVLREYFCYYWVECVCGVVGVIFLGGLLKAEDGYFSMFVNILW